MAHVTREITFVAFFGLLCLQALRSLREGYEAWLLQCLPVQSFPSEDEQPLDRTGGPQLLLFPDSEAAIHRREIAPYSV